MRKRPPSYREYMTNVFRRTVLNQYEPYIEVRENEIVRLIGTLGLNDLLSVGYLTVIGVDEYGRRIFTMKRLLDN